MATSIIKHDDTGWIALDSSVSYRKKNGVIFVRAYWANTTINTAWAIKATLPSGYRPTGDIYFPAISTNTSQVLAYITSTGNIGLRTNTGTASYSAFIISFPLS